ncbi:hypothetical protein FACS1894141_7140 [Spirochaetia bacterium]|nr:hypothetical protein FACS1894141_7140 [Spirochaetia bacterium]
MGEIMAKELTITVEDDVYEILEPMIELKTINRFLSDFTRKLNKKTVNTHWLGKVYKVDSFTPLKRPELYDR